LVAARHYEITQTWKVGDEVTAVDLQDGAMRSFELTNLSQGNTSALATLAFH
jgi:hypothetical protein